MVMEVHERPTHSWEEEVREVLWSAFGGARYGAKIRLPHALVMSLLFGGAAVATTPGKRQRDLASVFRKAVSLTVEHASSLAKFAAIYKTLLFAFKLLRRSLSSSSHHRKNDPHSSVVVGQPQQSWDAALAGAIGGYYCWGRYSAVNQQLLLYLSSRVLLGVWKKLAGNNTTTRIMMIPYPMVAAMIWGAVMYLFEDDPQVLHPSLKSSMDEIYRYSSTVPGAQLGGRQ
jgi:peroxisomal membrane protein 4